MPELPEVETIRRSLLRHLPGRRVEGVTFGDPKILKVPREHLAARITGSRFQDIGRRGKYLLFELDHDCLVIHLGMSGQLTLRDPRVQDSPGFLRHPVTQLQQARQHTPDRHTHLQLFLDDSRVLCLRDPRKFGKVLLLAPSEDALKEFFEPRLGLEPLAGEYRLEAFLQRLGQRKTPIKALLLNQKVVAGIGNIYADEALFEAGIHPRRRVHGLRRSEKVRLFHAVRTVLQKAVHFGGTTLRDYVDSDGREGGFQEVLQVYGRAGEPCRRCGTPVVKEFLVQRGTHYCPTCQK
jgi:formamidopyrimidine-DNA glycosylase